MIEPELVFADLNDNMRLAEDYVRHCCQYLLDHNLPEME
jgi:asparaginyl-tRNA synthetase